MTSENQELSSGISKVQVQYIKDHDYSPKYINGVLGGLSTKGEIVLNFYTEFNEVPLYQTFEFHVATSGLGKEILEERSPKFINDGLFIITRKILTGIVLNKNEAKGLYQLLGEHLAQLEMQENKITL